MARILIVEDESFSSNALANVLQTQGHFFVRAQTGQAAREMLVAQDFNCIIADAKLAGWSGIQLAAWVRQNKPTPFIIMARFADQADPVAPFGLTGVTLLVKPFNLEGVRQALKAAVPGGLSESNSARDSLVPVPKRMIKIAGVADFTVYHYKDGQPQKLVSKGSPFIVEKFGLPPEVRFYTDRESLSALMASSMNLAKGAAQNTKVDPMRRANLVQSALQTISEQMAVMGIEQELVEAASEMLTTYMQSIDDKDIWDMIANLDSYSKPIYAQTLATTMVSLLIAQEQLFPAPDCFKLTTAALFHDIGYTQLDATLLKTPRVLLSMKDRAMLEKHVEIGVALLQKSGWVSTEICNIIWQHHESEVGNGYPRGLKSPNVHVMARIIRLADEFCFSVMKSGTQPGMPPLRALEQLKGKRELDQKFVVALYRVLNRSRAKEKEPV